MICIIQNHKSGDYLFISHDFQSLLKRYPNLDIMYQQFHFLKLGECNKHKP